MNENNCMFMLNAGSWIFTAMLLWIGQKKEIGWLWFGKALAKKDFLGWWWKELALILAMLTGIMFCGGFIEILQEDGTFEPVMYGIYWLLCPLYIICLSLMVSIIIKRARVVEHGKAFGAVVLFLSLLTNVLGQLLLWLMCLCLYVMTEKDEVDATVQGEMAEASKCIRV